MTNLTIIPACGQIFMQPHASPGFDAWGVFVADKWVQIGGTSVDLSTNDALAQLVAQGACAPNSDPVDLTPEPEGHENITNAATPAETTGISDWPISAQDIISGVVLVLVAVGGWLYLRPRKNRVTKFTGSSSGAVDRLSKITQEDNDA
ncbi:MAG: hypothetical protein AAFY26_20695 [Cyanobacteria bacterium J06638_22]